MDCGNLEIIEFTKVCVENREKLQVKYKHN